MLVTDTPAFYAPGRGPQVAWELTLNSYDPGSETSPFNYLFGPHARRPYQAHVVDLGNEARVITPDGREDWYVAVDPNADPVVYNPAAGTGIFPKVSKDKTADLFRLELKEHGVFVFAKKFSFGGVTYYAITRMADAVGAALTLAYNNDPVPKLLTVTDANGAVSQVVYNPAGHASRIDDPFGANAQFGYTNVAGVDRLSAITDQAGYTSLLGHDLHFLKSLGSMSVSIRIRGFLKEALPSRFAVVKNAADRKREGQGWPSISVPRTGSNGRSG